MVWGSTKIGRKKFVENILENRINAYKKYVNSLRISDGACHVSFIYIFWKKFAQNAPNTHTACRTDFLANSCRI